MYVYIFHWPLKSVIKFCSADAISAIWSVCYIFHKNSWNTNALSQVSNLCLSLPNYNLLLPIYQSIHLVFQVSQTFSVLPIAFNTFKRTDSESDQLCGTERVWLVRLHAILLFPYFKLVHVTMSTTTDCTHAIYVTNRKINVYQWYQHVASSWKPACL